MTEEKKLKTIKAKVIKVEKKAEAKVKKTTQKIKSKRAEVKKEKDSPPEEVKNQTKKLEKTLNLTLDVLDTKGKKVESITLPEEIFGVKPNPFLLAQAIRVYLANQRLGNASTKTRGEVDGSTRKIYRQKGTGKARHGGIRAPIFVKGGIAHGPKPKDYNLKLNKKMKQTVLKLALSEKALANEIKIVEGLQQLKLKTKEFNLAFKAWSISEKKRSSLLVLNKDSETIYKGARNLKGVLITTISRVNVYEILKYKNLILEKQALDLLKERIKNK